MYKKIICAVLSAFILGWCVRCFYISVEADSKAEIVMEVSSGKTLEEKDADARLPMASTTKIMTAIIIIEDCNLDDIITVPEKAIGVEGSSVYLKHGESISIKDLLYGLMLRSGNDCAAALAIFHSGTVETFADCMNEKARSLGLINTHFCNPSGLPDEEHFTSARDLCKLACYAMKNEIFREVVGTTNYIGKYRSYTNKNKMLYNFDGATGIKTGYTIKAGRCLVSSAYRDGFEVICVVLNCPDMYERSTQLLENCFKEYCMLTIDKEKIFMCGSQACIISGEYNVLVKKNSKIEYEVIEFNNNTSKCRGILRIYSENDLIFEQKLYSINYEK